MAEYPEKLAEMVEDFESITDRTERAEMLIEIADRFNEVKVPAEIATKPYPEDNHVKFCESDAYVWAIDQPDGSLKFYFDVLNPQGLSAKAMSVILNDSLEGEKPEQILKVPHEVVQQIFGREISMGKGQGLMGIIMQMQHEARKRLNKN
jgi:cysteine desulfuration protein SufE